MNLRLIEIILPDQDRQRLEELLQGHSTLGNWNTQIANHLSLVKVLLYSQEVEEVVDQLEEEFSQTPSFCILVLSVETMIPRTKPAEEMNAKARASDEHWLDLKLSRINRQELYETLSKTVALTWTHLLMVLLSTTIAAIGLLRNNSTIIIGAMVIAPLLGPNMALSLATVLGDTSLALRAIRIGAVGIAISLTFSILTGLLISVSPEIPEIAFRTQVGSSDVVLALASGMAGALSLTSGVTSAIVGVMVAVALLPPLVTLGMLLGSGHWQVAVGSILLLLTNLICLNLAGMLTFLIQQLRPDQWWKAYKAKRVTLVAFSLWLTLLFALVTGIFAWQRNHAP